MKKKPRAGPRQGAWHTFHKHWLATGVASMAKGGRPRLGEWAGMTQCPAQKFWG